MAQALGKSPWMEITLERQLSDERDFAQTNEAKLVYGILCGHRMGSNLLSESLYLTGMLGDPMEFFNLRWLQKFRAKHSANYSDFPSFLAFLKSRRTSPNGVFGYNLKVDQFKTVIPRNFNGKQWAPSLLQQTEKFVFLRRRDRLDQAISNYIGKHKDTFRIPVEADLDEIHKIVDDVPFKPVVISNQISESIEYDKAWENFLANNDKPVFEIYYEDMVADFEGSIRAVAEFIIGTRDVEVPEQPTAKIAGAKNQELKKLYLEHLLDQPI